MKSGARRGSDEKLEENMKNLRKRTDELKDLLNDDRPRRKGHLIFTPWFVVTYLLMATAFVTAVVLHLKGYT